MTDILCHVLRTAPWREIEVADSVNDRFGFMTYAPRYKVTWRVRGSLREKLIPFIPSYVFIWCRGTDSRVWHDLRSVNGSFGLLGGLTPWVVGENEISRLRAQVGEDGELSVEVRKKLLGFREGDTIKFNSGPFAGFEGVCETIDDEAILLGVKIALLGRERVIYVPAAWCDPGQTSSGWSQPTNRRKQRAKDRLAV